ERHDRHDALDALAEHVERDRRPRHVGADRVDGHRRGLQPREIALPDRWQIGHQIEEPFDVLRLALALELHHAGPNLAVALRRSVLTWPFHGVGGTGITR